MPNTFWSSRLDRLWTGLVDASSVRVSLPLGRLFSDLYQHGFLADVNNVPWFGGRVLSFASG